MNQKIELYHPYGFWYGSLYQNRTYIIWAIGLFLLAILGGFLFYRWYKRRLNRLKRPWELALERLERLEPALFADNKKKFYFELSVLMRDYCGRRYGIIEASSMTDKQLCMALKEHECAYADYIQEINFQMLLIKFADQASEMAHMALIREKTRIFVQKTVPS